MAVVNITGGSFATSTYSTVTIYTCPSGRNARVEITAAKSSASSNLDGTVALGKIDNIATYFGNSITSSASNPVSSHTTTTYVPGGRSITATSANGYYVAIEEG